MPSFNETPDVPKPFGYKILWLALKTSDPASVVAALECGEATPANWASGLAAAYGDPQSGEPWAFVSPPINGWVLVVSSSLPYPGETHDDIGTRFETLFSRLVQRFDDAQFFGSHRVSDFVVWARARNGKPVRIFASGDEVTVNFGEQTAEEAKLGFANLSGLSPPAAWDEIYRVAGERQAETDALVAAGLSEREADESPAKRPRHSR